MVFDVLGAKIPIIVKKLENEYGHYDYGTKTIYIDSDDSGLGLLDTLIHETFHSLSDRLGLGNAGFSNDLEEIIASTLPVVLLENFSIKVKCKLK